MKAVKVIFKILLILILILALVVGGYIGYLTFQYSRIADFAPLEIQNQAEEAQPVRVGEEYTAVTFNIGFGAYDQAFSFFMDTGVMADGTEVTGKSSRAASEAAARNNTTGAVSTLREMNPDFLLLQEVDVEAHRSHKVNQVQQIEYAFGDFASVYASNFHTAYLFWPVTSPIGSIESGLLTLSRYELTNAVRRQYPVDESFPEKFFDLDRCFSVQWLPVEGGTGDLVLINTHMSAYDEGGVIRGEQMRLLTEFMAAERAKGNYVIVGGDYNHALGDTVTAFPTGQKIPDWVVQFDEGSLPDGFRVVHADNNTGVATCRGADIPYTPGVNYTTVLDGFIVSDNVNASALNIDADFANSDHNPVQLRFSLQAAEGGEGESQEGEAEGEPEEGQEG